MAQINDFSRMLAAYGVKEATPPAPRAQARGGGPSLECSAYEQNKCIVRRGLKDSVCGKGVVRGVSEDGLTHIWVTIKCGKWVCDECGPRRLKLVRYGIEREAVRLKMNKLMTLTLPSTYSGDGFLQLYGAWTLFCQRLRKRFPGEKFHYVAAVELQPDRKAPHLHVITNKFLPQRWISSCWQSCGGGRIVDIRVKDIHKMAEYVTYVSKDFCKDYFPSGVRRFRTSRSVKLFRREKMKGYTWEFFDFSIRQAWDRFAYDGKPMLLSSGFSVSFEKPKKELDKGSPHSVMYQYLPFYDGSL